MTVYGYLQAGIDAVISREGGDVLAFERADRAGAWQLPQGGPDSAEPAPGDCVERPHSL